MTEITEITLKTVCCTCLSVDRKLKNLCRVEDGVNNLFFLLSYNFDAYEAIFNKGAANFSICWECEALMARLCKFRDRACLAQQHLSGLVAGWNCRKIPNSLSKLQCYKNKNNYDFVENDFIPDNFVDCGPDLSFIKAENDSDDIPLAELFTKDIEPSQPFFIKGELKNSSGCKEGNNITLKEKNKNSKEVECSTFKMTENNMLERRRSQMLDHCYFTSSKCESCFLVFKDSNDLKKHNLELHPEDLEKPKDIEEITNKQTSKGYVCKECNKSFDTQNKKYKHIQRCHREPFKCTTCGKTFAFKTILKTHEQLLHAGPIPREQCPTCGKLIRQDLVKVHARTHMHRQSYVCVPCDRRFVSRASYDNHMKNSKPHTDKDILKHKCTECSKGYKCQSELRDHINYQHLRRTVHKCPICHKALATRRCITRHVRRTHHGIEERARDKICQTCGKAFRDKKCLREHEWIHSGERPFSCAPCGRTFRQQASLYTHRRRVHHEPPVRDTRPPVRHQDEPVTS